MKDSKSNFLLYGLIIGGLAGAGLVIYFSSKFVITSKKNKQERKNKFYEGLDDIFEASAKNIVAEDSVVDKDTEKEIIDELFSRSNN
jgi:hypothetical protein